jgi:hypothetical protein
MGNSTSHEEKYDKEGYTPLINNVKNKSSIEEMQSLITSGADVNDYIFIKGEDGGRNTQNFYTTPLYHTLIYDDNKKARLLIDNGADFRMFYNKDPHNPTQLNLSNRVINTKVLPKTISYDDLSKLIGIEEPFNTLFKATKMTMKELFTNKRADEIDAITGEIFSNSFLKNIEELDTEEKEKGKEKEKEKVKSYAAAIYNENKQQIIDLASASSSIKEITDLFIKAGIEYKYFHLGLPREGKKKAYIELNKFDQLFDDYKGPNLGGKKKGIKTRKTRKTRKNIKGRKSRK